MAVITFPNIKSPASLEWSLVSNTIPFTSPLSKAVQTVEFPGARWSASLAYPVMPESEAALMRAFLVKLRGQANRFYLPNYSKPYPRGTINLTGVTVNGALAQGATSATFASAGNAKTLLTGDFFSIGGELKMAVADATSSSGGAITVTFEPPLRSAVTNGSAVVLAKPTVLMMLKEPASSWGLRPGQISNFNLDCIESFS